MAHDFSDIWREAYRQRTAAASWEAVEAWLASRLQRWLAVVEAGVLKWSSVSQGSGEGLAFLLGAEVQSLARHSSLRCAAC